MELRRRETDRDVWKSRYKGTQNEEENETSSFERVSICGQHIE